MTRFSARRSGEAIARRKALGLMASLPIAGAVAGCAAPEPVSWPRLPGAGERFMNVGRAPTTFNDAPMLAERVRAGKLPPVRRRLPEVPYVVRPEILVASDRMQMRRGTYGGVLQMAQETPASDPMIYLGHVEPLIWAPSAFGFDQEVEGNVAEGFETRRNSTEFVFHLRKGMCWSDGVPVTTEDVAFAYHDVLLNEDITPGFPAYLRTGGEAEAAPAELRIVDDFTFLLRFDGTYGGFVSQIAITGWISYSDLLKPKHYLTKFHRKYASRRELAERTRRESIPEDQWYILFNNKQAIGGLTKLTSEEGIGHPSLTPWNIVEANTGVFTYERNPYYFKVDPDGNQLPYIDGIRSQTVQDKATITARALMGEFDYAGERASLRQLPLLSAQEKRGEIKISIARMHRIPINFILNLTYDDAAWRKVVREVRFRQALNLAINRREIIDNFYLGQFATLPKELNPPEYDLEGANALLDEIGMDRRDEGGFRMDPDGNPFRIPFEIADMAEDFLPMSQLIAEYWQQVGVRTTVRPIDLGLHAERRVTNDLRATALWAHLDIWPHAAYRDYLPTDQWGVLWQNWYDSRGERGEEPPDEVKRLFGFHQDLLSATPGTDSARNAYQEIVRSYYQNIWFFVPVERSSYPTFFSKRMHNVPHGTNDRTYGLIYNMSMEQWYIDER